MRNLPLPLESQSFMETFDKVAQDCFDMLVSKKVYNHDDNLFYKYGGMARTRDPAEQPMPKRKIDDIVDASPPRSSRSPWLLGIMSFAGLSKGTKSVPLPQFANTLPRTYYTVANNYERRKT
jgi:hypothetical protein